MRSEISTGTSAPPMGRTKMTPRTSDSTAVMTIKVTLPVSSVARARADDGHTDEYR